MTQLDPRRKLTEKEIEHATDLLFRCTERQLAAHLGCKEAQLSHTLRGKSTLQESLIAKLMSTKRADVPSKPPRPKPSFGSKILATPRCESLYYREESGS